MNNIKIISSIYHLKSSLILYTMNNKCYKVSVYDNLQCLFSKE